MTCLTQTLKKVSCLPIFPKFGLPRLLTSKLADITIRGKQPEWNLPTYTQAATGGVRQAVSGSLQINNGFTMVFQGYIFSATMVPSIIANTFTYILL